MHAETVALLHDNIKPCFIGSSLALLDMRDEVEDEAARLAERFQPTEGARVSQAQFAREFDVPGGASMVTQHIKGTRPISFEAAIAYARGFNVPLHQISQRAADLWHSASEVMGSASSDTRKVQRLNRAIGPKDALMALWDATSQHDADHREGVAQLVKGMLKNTTDRAAAEHAAENIERLLAPPQPTDAHSAANG
jgi:hypothetical protein